jgi:hypothetical protein
MVPRGFIFSAQFALDRAHAARESRELSLTQALRLHESELVVTQALAATLLQTESAVDAARRRLAENAGQSGEDLLNARQMLDTLRALRRRQAESLKARRQLAEAAGERVRAARAAFEEADAALRVLQQVRDARLREYKMARNIAAERADEEAALQAWRRGQDSR